MAHINVNLNDVPKQEPHDECDLHVRVTKAEIKDNNSGDGQHILWTLTPVTAENKSPVWLRTSLKPQALFILVAFLKALGLQWDPDGSFDTDEAQGRECVVHVTKTMYQGEPRNEVERPFQAV